MQPRTKVNRYVGASDMESASTAEPVKSAAVSCVTTSTFTAFVLCLCSPPGPTQLALCNMVHAPWHIFVPCSHSDCFVWTPNQCRYKTVDAGSCTVYVCILHVLYGRLIRGNMNNQGSSGVSRLEQGKAICEIAVWWWQTLTNKWGPNWELLDFVPVGTGKK